MDPAAMSARRLVVALSALVFVACASSQAEAPPPNAPVAAAPSSSVPAAAPPPAPNTPVASEPAPPAAADLPFSAMSPAQRLVHMKTVIRPEMGKLFQDFDPARFADFGCKTCHGPNGDDTHDVLPRLHFTGGGHEKLAAEKPAIMKFMIETVAPSMADKLHEKRYDQATRTGFGCGGCHKIT
jgi:hypothetical protein